MTAHLRQEGFGVNPKGVRRLLRLMGLEAIYPRKRLTVAAAEHRVYPYLLAGVEVERPDQVSGALWARTSPTSGYRGASSSWWRCWTGTAATCSPGRCRRRWRGASVCGRWRRP